MNEGVQYKRGTSSVQMRICSKLGRNMSTNEDVQYKRGVSLLEMRMYNVSKAYHQYEQGCAVRVRQIIRFWKGEAGFYLGFFAWGKSILKKNFQAF